MHPIFTNESPLARAFVAFVFCLMRSRKAPSLSYCFIMTDGFRGSENTKKTFVMHWLLL